MLELPYSKARRYLTGIDWVIHTLNDMTMRATGVGNSSQIVLEIDGIPPEDELRERLGAFIGKFPVLYGSLGRDAFNLAPYWKMPPLGWSPPPLPLTVHRLEEGADATAVHRLLEQAVNRPFGSPREHLAFHLVAVGKLSYLVFTFDHRLLDARGAEAFLGMFQEEWEGGEDRSDGISLTEPAHLDHWEEKFEAGRQLNRMLLCREKSTPPSSLPLPANLMGRGYRFRVIPFDEQQTAAIDENTNENAGFLMFMPYSLAAAARAMHPVFTRRGMRSADDYIISVSIDMRPHQKVERDLFFNHLSFLLFTMGKEEMESFPALLDSIKRQMYEQVKSKFPQNLREVLHLTRIAPLPLMHTVMRLYFKGSLVSFSFSYVSESAYRPSSFMKERVKNIFHMPRVPAPPGLGIFFTRFHGKLNAVLSSMDGLLRDDEADTILRGLRSSLGV